jgi:hypothetical protein
MRLPEIAARLRQLAVELPCEELNALATEIGRRQLGPRAPSTSNRINDEIRERIRSIHKENPSLTQAEIAMQVGVNPGRVSETLRGKRK